jgi:hypothetical protein
MWLDLAATEHTLSLDILTDRRARSLTGDLSRSEQVRVMTSRGDSTTEIYALNAIIQAEQEAELEQHVDTTIRAIRELRHYMRHTIMRGPDLPAEEPMPICKEGQHGKEGAIVWGDTTCELSVVKGGMCTSHYFAWWRHRKAKGIDTSADFAA